MDSILYSTPDNPVLENCIEGFFKRFDGHKPRYTAINCLFCWSTLSRRTCPASPLRLDRRHPILGEWLPSRGIECRRSLSRRFPHR
ncbi:hypothetical protein EXN67_08665 [Rhizobium rhizogenes]|nr:hypothetical protein DXT98_22135 [Agrobacterium sp. ICMP 7243]MQB32314.1 hypothetical protein [Rhizobium rhizogenes]TQO75305.1 hypothetical protein FFE80_26200 [Rhizobium rhizogenes]TRB12738.1 hypothetical protein EXN67_08665 [Rhizobium rhizogenes]TRB21362.1 hypothetical protein EXN70_20850 [Rhizobium rhizogenes]